MTYPVHLGSGKSEKDIGRFCRVRVSSFRLASLAPLIQHFCTTYRLKNICVRSNEMPSGGAPMYGLLVRADRPVTLAL